MGKPRIDIVLHHHMEHLEPGRCLLGRAEASTRLKQRPEVTGSTWKVSSSMSGIESRLSLLETVPRCSYRA